VLPIGRVHTRRHRFVVVSGSPVFRLVQSSQLIFPLREVRRRSSWTWSLCLRNLEENNFRSTSQKILLRDSSVGLSHQLAPLRGLERLVGRSVFLVRRSWVTAYRRFSGMATTSQPKTLQTGALPFAPELPQCLLSQTGSTSQEVNRPAMAQHSQNGTGVYGKP